MERRPIPSAPVAVLTRRALPASTVIAAPLPKRGAAIPTVAAPKRGAAPVQPTKAKFVPTGSMMLDCALAGTHGPGGWAIARVVNVVGDRSSGKTLLAVEACANFAMISPITNIRYVEAESAFDEEYGQVVGMPSGIHPVDNIRTIEEFFKDLMAWCELQKKNPYPALYVLDSLDALSDDAEMVRKVGDGSYGMAKSKMLSEMFRRMIKDLTEANCTLLIISQVREKIAVAFGETKTRSGGKALDFYATQIIWLAELGKVTRTVYGQKRVIGVDVRVRCRKNKLGPAHREAEQMMLFGYGIDDESSMIKWAGQAGALTSTKEWLASVTEARESGDRERIKQINTALREIVWERWSNIESQLAPVINKYERKA